MTKWASLKRVSTHSRPKAAGLLAILLKMLIVSFNTQPPEGGWYFPRYGLNQPYCFNTQPPEGGWVSQVTGISVYKLFQHTAARRRLGSPSASSRIPRKFQHTAARRRLVYSNRAYQYHRACFNTQPPEGGWRKRTAKHSTQRVSTHSRPKAAGKREGLAYLKTPVSTHSRPKAAGCLR